MYFINNKLCILYTIVKKGFYLISGGHNIMLLSMTNILPSFKIWRTDFSPFLGNKTRQKMENNRV